PECTPPCTMPNACRWIGPSSSSPTTSSVRARTIRSPIALLQVVVSFSLIASDLSPLCCPVRLAQAAPRYLAIRVARERRDEVDRARALVPSQPRPAVRDQRLGQRRAGLHAGSRRDQRFDALAPLLVGDAEDCGIVDARVLAERRLHFRG